MHPDKTFLGCIKKGFDFLGIYFGETPEISKTSLENYRSKLAPLYAQGVSAAGICDYVVRWRSWCAGLLKCYREQLDVSNSMGQEDNRQLGPRTNQQGDNYEEILYCSTRA